MKREKGGGEESTRYRVTLTPEQREEWGRRTHELKVMPRTRDRLERIRLSHAGGRIPQIARPLQLDEDRVRHWIKQFLEGGFDALPDQPHRGQKSAVTPEIMASIRARIARADRTWMARQ